MNGVPETTAGTPRTLREKLNDQGFRVEDGPDGGLAFRYEGSTFFIPASDDDPQFYQVLLPNFWELESDEEYGRALLACDAVNRHVKLVKVHTMDGDTWATVEAAHATPADFLAFLPRYLSYLQDALRVFRDHML